ncbi:MAG: ParB/RepB/Spo0J family partition protein [Sporolactobacillus sp.]
MSKALGKGLDAFFPNAFTNETDHDVDSLATKDLRPNPYQPRKSFDDKTLDELALSIKEHGIIQPLIVRKSIKGYDIIAGERRYRAAIRAGLTEVPAIIKELDEQAMMQIALIENLQREDLNPIEEATAYKKLIDGLKITQEELAEKLGKSRPHIANYIRLLQLDRSVRHLLEEGKLSMGHGRALVGVRDKKKIPLLIDKTLKDQLNVRQLEALIQKLNHVPRETSKKDSKLLPPEVKERINNLQERLGTKVAIRPGASKEKGRIELTYYSADDLYRLLELLGSRSV